MPDSVTRTRDEALALAKKIAKLAQATEKLVSEGFQVLCYTTDDPVVARQLKEAGATSVMPAGSPIGSGQGILNPNNIKICLEYLKDLDPEYPVIVDAGVGTASDVSSRTMLTTSSTYGLDLESTSSCVGSSVLG